MRAVTKEQAQQWRLRSALARRQRGFIINPYAFGGAGPVSWVSQVTALAPLGWWRLGEASGNAINSGSTSSADLSTTGVGLTRNVTGLITGDSNGACSTSSGTFSAALPGAMALDRSVSVVAWVNFNTTSVVHPILYNGYDFRINTANRVEISNFSVIILTASTAMSLNTRYMLAWTIGSGGTATFTNYLNGVADGSGSSSQVRTASANILLFGDTFNNFRGVLDEVLFFNYVLSPTQVADLYAAGV